jgi:hypothetical protein
VFFFAHLGLGLGLAWLVAWKLPVAFDYRLVLFGSLLPDIIDKPLGYLLGLEGRIWAHTLVFLFAVLVLSFAPGLWSLRFVAFGVGTHYLVDRLWESPRILLYPAFGWSFKTLAFDTERWVYTLLNDPLVQAGEVVGLTILIAFAWRYRLGSWKALRDFARHGTLSRSTPNQP